MNQSMTHKLNLTIEKQESKITLLEEELQATHDALEEKIDLISALEIDLEHVVLQLEKLKKLSVGGITNTLN